MLGLGLELQTHSGRPRRDMPRRKQKPTRRRKSQAVRNKTIRRKGYDVIAGGRIVRSKDLGKPIPITLSSDPSEEQGDKPMVFHCRYMDTFEGGRYQQIARKVVTIPERAESKRRFELSDEAVNEQMEFLGSLVVQIDNWDGEANITDKDKIVAILRKLPQDMTGELSLAVASYKELLKLKNQSPSGLNAEPTAIVTSPRLDTTDGTAEPVSAEGMTERSGSAGETITHDIQSSGGHPEFTEPDMAGSR